MALFLFLLGKAALASLPAAHFWDDAIFSFSADPVFSSFLLKFGPLYKFSVGLGNTNKPATFFSFPQSLAFSSTHCPLLHLFFNLRPSGTSCMDYPRSPSLLLDSNKSPDTHFFRKTTHLISWKSVEDYSCLLQSLVVPLLLHLVSTYLFYWTGGALSQLNSSTNRFPRFPLKNLCFLVMLTVLSLLFAAMDTTFC